MPVSQNGWSANDRSVIETYTVGQKTRVALRKGDAGFLLKHFADWFDKNIRDIDYNYNNGQLDDWGYAERPIRGGTTLSNHASGTAIDINATCWPLGRDESVYLTADEIRRVREQLKVYEGAIRWGGDYDGRQDPMHFEINTDAATVARVAAKLRGATAPLPPKPAPRPAPRPAPKPAGRATIKQGSRGTLVWDLQRKLTKYYPAYNKYTPTGFFGPKTTAGVKEFQRRSGLKVDGIVGPNTWKALGF